MSSHAPCGDKPGPASNTLKAPKVTKALKVPKVLKVLNDLKALNETINF